MKFDEKKLRQLATYSKSLLDGQRRADKMSAAARDMEIGEPFRRRMVALDREIAGNEKTASRIATLVRDLGITDMDRDTERTWHDGWAERK